MKNFYPSWISHADNKRCIPLPVIVFCIQVLCKIMLVGTFFGSQLSSIVVKSHHSGGRYTPSTYLVQDENVTLHPCRLMKFFSDFHASEKNLSFVPNQSHYHFSFPLQIGCFFFWYTWWVYNIKEPQPQALSHKVICISVLQWFQVFCPYNCPSTRCTANQNGNQMVMPESWLKTLTKCKELPYAYLFCHSSSSTKQSVIQNCKMAFPDNCNLPKVRCYKQVKRKTTFMNIMRR